jgi:hypothetical protein
MNPVKTYSDQDGVPSPPNWHWKAHAAQHPVSTACPAPDWQAGGPWMPAPEEAPADLPDRPAGYEGDQPADVPASAGAACNGAGHARESRAGQYDGRSEALRAAIRRDAREAERKRRAGVDIGVRWSWAATVEPRMQLCPIPAIYPTLGGHTHVLGLHRFPNVLCPAMAGRGARRVVAVRCKRRLKSAEVDGPVVRQLPGHIPVGGIVASNTLDW